MKWLCGTGGRTNVHIYTTTSPPKPEHENSNASRLENPENKKTNTWNFGNAENVKNGELIIFKLAQILN